MSRGTYDNEIEKTKWYETALFWLLYLYFRPLKGNPSLQDVAVDYMFDRIIN